MAQLERIFKLLEASGLEQKAFAAEIGVSEDTISNWKHGKSASYNKYLSQIAAVLDTSVEYLITGKEPDPFGVGALDELEPADMDILRQIHDRPGLRIMFDLSAKASDEDIAKAVDILKAYYGIKEDKP